jgi:hypothetical protein
MDHGQKLPWTTLTPAEDAGPGEALHSAWFEPPHWPDDQPAIMIELPACEMHFGWLVGESPKTETFNYPSGDAEIAVTYSARIAADEKAWLTIMCDTQAEAERYAAMAAVHLPATAASHSSAWARP